MTKIDFTGLYARQASLNKACQNAFQQIDGEINAFRIELTKFREQQEVPPFLDYGEESLDKLSEVLELLRIRASKIPKNYE